MSYSSFMVNAMVPWWIFLYPLITVALLLLLALFAKRTRGRGRRVALILNITVTSIYLVWRLFFTIPTDNGFAMTVGIVLLVTETLGAIQTFLFAVTLWRPVRPRQVPLPAEGPYPSVDIFVTTYNEPDATLVPTLAATAAIRYPGEVTVYLCDDGNRPELAALAERFGAQLLSRPTNEHAKAGNLNYALAHSRGDLVVTMDADMIPRENLLESTVGFFMEDPTLGLVQAPQAFYNEDPFQYNLFAGSRLPNEQDFFMRELQGGYERFNATMYVGSNAVIRRGALDEIGGFATGGLTEDFATGQLLQSKQIRIAYVGEVIAAGLAAEDVADLLKQRDRWCRGAIQCAKQFNPFTMPGLSFMQRLIYANRVMYWYFGIFKAVYLFTPLLYLLFGITALDIELWQLVVFWVPYYLSSFTAFRILSGGRRTFTWSHIYEIAMGPYLAVSAVAETLGIGGGTFAVTPKGVTSDRRVMHWRLAVPHLTFLALAIVGLLNVYWWNAATFRVEYTLIPVLWTAYNMIGAAMSVFVFMQRPRVRGVERTLVEIPTTVRARGARAHGTSAEAVIDDLSSTGARLRLDRHDADGGLGGEILLHLPSPDSRSEGVAPSGRPVEVRAEVMWAAPADAADAARIGVRFIDPAPEAQVRIMQYITRSPGWVRHDRETHSTVLGVSSEVVRGLRAVPVAQQRRELRLPPGNGRAVSLLRPATGEQIAAAEVLDLSASGMQVRVLCADAEVVAGEHLTLGPADGAAGYPAAESGRIVEVRWRRDMGKFTLLGLKFEAAGQSDQGLASVGAASDH